MIRRVLLALPAVFAASSADAQQKLVIPLKWYRVKVEDDAFTVEMPGIPDHRVVEDRSARGTAFAMHSYSLETGGYSYVAQTALYPADVDTTQPRRILQAALDGRAQQLATRKWSSVQWRDIDGAAAVESAGGLSGGSALRQLVVLKGHRFVSLAFLGAAVNVMEANRFFTSLKLS
ncbi:MAG TPA: hypothetical protein VFB13_03080 [Reyranella sp.]|nr:hypothetical protein [Reyranella sp.]